MIKPEYIALICATIAAILTPLHKINVWARLWEQASIFCGVLFMTLLAASFMFGFSGMISVETFVRDYVAAALLIGIWMVAFGLYSERTERRAKEGYFVKDESLGFLCGIVGAFGVISFIKIFA